MFHPFFTPFHVKKNTIQYLFIKFLLHFTNTMDFKEKNKIDKIIPSRPTN